MESNSRSESGEAEIRIFKKNLQLVAKVNSARVEARNRQVGEGGLTIRGGGNARGHNRATG